MQLSTYKHTLSLPPCIMGVTLWTFTFTFHTHLSFMVIRCTVYVRRIKNQSPPWLSGTNGKNIKYMWWDSNLLARPPQPILKYKVWHMTDCGMDGRGVMFCLLARARGALIHSYQPDTGPHAASYSNGNATGAWILTLTQTSVDINPYPTAFPYGNGMVLHFYQQQESSTTKTVHKVINKGLKAYV